MMDKERASDAGENSLQNAVFGELAELKGRYDSLKTVFRKIIDDVCKENPKEMEKQRRMVPISIEITGENTSAAVYALLDGLGRATGILSQEQTKVLEKEVLVELEKAFGMIGRELKLCRESLNDTKNIHRITEIKTAFCNHVRNINGCILLLAEEVEGISSDEGVFVGVSNLYMNPNYHTTPGGDVYEQRRLISSGRDAAHSVVLFRFRLPSNADEEAVVDEVTAFLSGLRKKMVGIRAINAHYGNMDAEFGGEKFIGISVYYNGQNRKAILGALMPQFRFLMQKYEGIRQTVVPASHVKAR